MTYRVILQPEALADIEEAYHWIAEQAPHPAVAWYDGLMEILATLAEHPRRCSLAPEDGAFSPEIRQLLYGKRRGLYRILFTIVDDRVHILHIRHGARAWLEDTD